MNKVCLKSMCLVIVIFVIMLTMSSGGCSVNGRYQMTCIQDGEHSRAYVIDTQTGEVKELEIETHLGYKYQKNGELSKSRPWPNK